MVRLTHRLGLMNRLVSARIRNPQGSNMKLNHIFIAVLACASSFASFAIPVVPDSAAPKQAETVAVASAPAVQPEKISAKPTPKARAAKSVPIKTTGYQAGAEALPLPGVGVLPGNLKPELENNVIRITS